MTRGNGSGRHVLPSAYEPPSHPVPPEQYRHLMQWRWWLLVVVFTLVGAGFGSAIWLDSRFASRAQAEHYRSQHKTEHDNQRDKISDISSDLQDMQVINAKVAVSQENVADRLSIIEAQQRQQLNPHQRNKIGDEIKALHERIKKREKALLEARRKGQDPLKALEGI